MWLTDDEQRMWQAWLSAGPALAAAMNRQLQAESDLTLADYEVLVRLREAGATRVSALATALRWEQSRLSHQLTRMRRRGLVDREPVDGDRRGVAVALTGSGRAALDAAAPGHVALVRATVFAGLDDASVATVTAWLEQMTGRSTGSGRPRE